MDKMLDLPSGGKLIVRGIDGEGMAANVDVELVDEQGHRWFATVFTLDEVARLMDNWRASGECQAGAYFRVPDAVIVRNSSLSSVVSIFDEMLRTGEYRRELTQLGD